MVAISLQPYSPLLTTLISVSVTVMFVQARKCPQSVMNQIQHCVNPVAKYAENLGVGVGVPVKPVKTFNSGREDKGPIKGGKQVFDELCNEIYEFEKCVKDAKKECPGHITLSLINASYGYLCNDGKQKFMRNADCLMELDREASVRNCHDNTLEVIKVSSEQTSIPLKEKMHRMCQSLNYFAGCVQTPVRQRCGEGAWEVISRVLAATTTTLMPNCAFETPPSNPVIRVTRPLTTTHPPPFLLHTTRPRPNIEPPIQADTGLLGNPDPDYIGHHNKLTTNNAPSTPSLNVFALLTMLIPSLLLADVVRWNLLFRPEI